MRTVFLALLLINCAYFAWAHWVDAPHIIAASDSSAHLPRLRLADEVPAADRAGAATLARVVSSEPQACFSVGPFADVDNSARAAALLRAKGFDPHQRAEAGESSEGYWVFIGGMKTDTDADHTLVVLERGGIRDALLMPATADAGRRVSLGLFSERPRADKRAQAIRGLGLNAEVAERKLPGTVYWVDLAPQPGSSTIPIQDLFAEGVSSRIAVQSCPSAVHLQTVATGAASAAPAPQAAPPPVASAGKPAQVASH